MTQIRRAAYSKESANSPEADATGLAPFGNSLEQFLAGLSYIHLRIHWAVLRARAGGLNPDDEFLGLYISDEQVDTLLSRGVDQHPWHTLTMASENGHHWQAALEQARQHWRGRTIETRRADVPMRLETLVRAFGLDDVEVDALLITVAPEIDPAYGRLFAYLQDDVTRKQPSVDLILNLLSDDMESKLRLRRHFSREATLFRHQLLAPSEEASSGRARIQQALRPATVVVRYLLGELPLARALDGCATLEWSDAAESRGRLPKQLARKLRQAASGQGQFSELLPQGQPRLLPIFAFCGHAGVGRREAALLVARTLDSPLLTVDLPRLAADQASPLSALRLALRDARLLQAVLYLRGWDSILVDGRPDDSLLSLLLSHPGPIITAGQQRWQATAGAYRSRQRPILQVDFPTPDYEGRRRVWQRQLGSDAEAPANMIEPLANQFRFTPGQIEDAVATARDLALWRREPLGAAHLFDACRAHSNQKLATLATKIRPRYEWSDIVLPADTLSQLQEMVATVRRRPTVYEQWGFGRKLALGKGLNALFAGESGTGKTMAADIIAGELGQDLYKVDLSMLVSKYIGETEKNLSRIFAEAATSNAILFFDEADAIFGKRSEVKDSHDRYANIEISYLLQRMEAYDGVVILATNLRANLDEAFTRRLHFVVEFPFPQAADRERIWRVNVPSQTPLGDDVDFELLAQRYRLAGGNIRNIIMAAAFLAAEEEVVVSMRHLLHASRREFQKMGRLIDEQQFVMERVENRARE